MNIDTAALAFFILSLSLVITFLALYSSFGPGSEDLLDPFEEDNE